MLEFLGLIAVILILTTAAYYEGVRYGRKMERESRRLINPVKNPRHDAVYKEGVEWLDKQ